MLVSHTEWFRFCKVSEAALVGRHHFGSCYYYSFITTFVFLYSYPFPYVLAYLVVLLLLTA